MMTLKMMDITVRLVSVQVRALCGFLFLKIISFTLFLLLTKS